MPKANSLRCAAFRSISGEKAAKKDKILQKQLVEGKGSKPFIDTVNDNITDDIIKALLKGNSKGLTVKARRTTKRKAGKKDSSNNIIKTSAFVKNAKSRKRITKAKASSRRTLKVSMQMPFFLRKR